MSRKPRPRPRPVQSSRRPRDEDEDECGSGFDLLATPRTPYSAARIPATPKSARRQGSIFGPPARPRKSFDSLSDDESVDSYRSPPPRRRRDSFERSPRTPRMRRGFERMSRFFAPGHFPPRFEQGDPGGWQGHGRNPQTEKDPVQEQINQATMRLSLYRALCVLGSGLAGLFLILAYVLGGLVIATLPEYSQDGAQNPSTRVTIKARDGNYIPGSTMADLSSGVWGSVVIYISLAAGIFCLLSAVFQMFSEKIRRKSFDSLRNFMSGFADLEDEALPPASAMWKKYGTWNCKIWYLLAFSLPSTAAVVASLLVYFDQRGTLKSSLNGAGSVDFGQSSIFTMVATGMMLTGAGLNVLRQHLLVWLLEFRQHNGLIDNSPPPAYPSSGVLPQNPAESPSYQMKTAPAPSPYGHSRNPSAFSQGSAAYPNGSAFTLQRNPSTLQRSPSGAQHRNPSAFTQGSKGTYAAGSGFTINSRNPSAFTAGSYPNGSAFTLQSKKSQRSNRSKDLPWGPSQSENGIV